MKKLSLLLFIACIFVSCGPKEPQIQPVIKETRESKAEITATASTITYTFIPSPTDSPSRTPTETSTIIPSSTFTPTEKPSETPTITPTAKPTDTLTPIPTETQIPLAVTPTPEPSAPVVAIIGVNKIAEYVDIQNQGKIEVNLGGWNLVSEKGNQACPLSGILKAGETLRIWAMAAEGPGYSCGYSKSIWNNTEPDPAVLYNPEGVEVSRQ